MSMLDLYSSIVILQSMRNLPRYRKCFICGKDNSCGLNVTFKTNEEEVYAFVEFKDQHVGFKDRIHGGVISGLLDEVMGWACTIKTKRMYFTIGLNVKFRKPVRPYENFIAEAIYIGEKHGICTSKGILRDENGNILAEALGKYYPLTYEDQQEILKMLHREPEDNLPITEKDL